MITFNYIESKDRYVFCKDGIYWALSPEQVLEMHKVTRDLIPYVVQKIADNAEAAAEKAEKA